MSPAKTAAERKADERQRQKEAGRTAVTVHVRPEYVPEVRALEAKLQRRENRRGPRRAEVYRAAPCGGAPALPEMGPVLARQHAQAASAGAEKRRAA